MSVEDLFIRNDAGNIIEGYLGDDKQAKILFLLREPNSGGKRADHFWFYDAIRNNIDFDKIHNPQERRTAKIAQTKYINVLGTIASHFIQPDADITELLKKCAYINLYPIKGFGRSSKEYKETLKKLKPVSAENQVECGSLLKEDAFADIAGNRIGIIKKINCDFIVTTIDIFDALSAKEITKEVSNGFCYGKGRKFRKGIINGKTPIYEFYHPSYRISNQKLENMTVAE